MATLLASTAFRRRPVVAAGLAAVGWPGLATVADRATGRPQDAPGDLSILTINVWLGRADTGALATLIVRERPHFAVLPEAGPDYRDKLIPLLDGLGYRSWVSTAAGSEDGSSATLLASPAAGEATAQPGWAMRVRHLDATGGVLGAPAVWRTTRFEIVDVPGTDHRGVLVTVRRP